MKRKELNQKLSRLQSRAHNLQIDIQRLIADLESEEKMEKLTLSTENSKEGGDGNFPHEKHTENI